MAAKFRMGSKVWDLSGRKMDGRYNKCKIVGIEACNNYLGFFSESGFFSGFDSFKYKLAYVDVFTGKGCSHWVNESDISKTKPDDATN